MAANATCSDTVHESNDLILNIFTAGPSRKTKDKLKLQNINKITPKPLLKPTRLPVEEIREKPPKNESKIEINEKPIVFKTPRHNFQQEHYIKKQPVTSLFKHNPDIPNIQLKKQTQDEQPLFSSEEFTSLNLHPHLISGLAQRLKATRMTAVQKATIPKLIDGKDALVKSLTGSGKTLAYAIPIIQKLQERRPKLNRSEGIQALIILPTRELTIQSYECFVNLCRAFTWLVPGYLTGGEKKKSEKARIRKGITILVSTPGRLFDHLETTTSLDLQNVQWLVIDEADRLMELGFEESVRKIVAHIQNVSKTKRQTVLLSATLTQGVELMAGLALNEPEIINISNNNSDDLMSNEKFSFPTNLTQNFCFIPLKLRLVALSAFILDQCSRGHLKTLVFMPAQDVVDFHYFIFDAILKKALQKSELHLNLFKLHGNMKQQDRVQVFKEFRETKAGILLCTDVAARGLDLQNVDWIIQYSVPGRMEDYVHRIGRTARIGTKGRSLIFLLPSEKGFLQMMQEHKIGAKEMVLADILPSIKLILPSMIAIGRRETPRTNEEFATALQDMYERLISNSEEALQLARQGYMQYVRAYSSYPKVMRDILPFRSLHLGHLAKSFCLTEAPSDLSSKLVGMMNYEPYIRYPRNRDSNYSSARSYKRSAVVSEFDSGFGTELPKKFKKGPTGKKKI